MSAAGARAHPLDGVTRFPLVHALAGRRSRRFGLGMEIPTGPLAYRSERAAEPLSDLERQTLTFCAAGANGYNTGMEHTATAGPDELCSYPVRFVGRTAPSAAGIGASELLLTDDSGTYLTQIRESKSVDDLLKPGTLAETIDRFWSRVQRLSSYRIELPRHAPHYSPHNIWNANVTGSTVLIPVVDLSQILLDFLLVYMGAGFVPWDSVADRPIGDLHEEAASGIVDLSKRFSLQEFEQYIMACGAVEASIMCHNAVLALQAMGLGGWMFSGIDPISLLGGRPGVPAAGFRFVERREGLTPVCVGLAGHMEAYTPPWFDTPEEAVDAFLDRKYGATGTYSGRYQHPWKDDVIVQRGQVPDPALAEALRKVVRSIHDSFGVFPGTVPAVYTRFYAQAHHVDTDFYDTFYERDMLLHTHRTHHQEWHP